MKKSLHKLNLQNLFENGARIIETALQNMNKCIIGMCENNLSEMEKYTQETILNEKKLDTIHDTIIRRLFTRETLVFSREDRLYIINGIDEIVDKAEVVVRRASVYHPKEIPRELVPRLVAISERASIIGSLISEATIGIFTDFKKASALAEKISDIRRQAKQDDLHFSKNTLFVRVRYSGFCLFRSLNRLHNEMY